MSTGQYYNCCGKSICQGCSIPFVSLEIMRSVHFAIQIVNVDIVYYLLLTRYQIMRSVGCTMQIQTSFLSVWAKIETRAHDFSGRYTLTSLLCVVSTFIRNPSCYVCRIHCDYGHIAQPCLETSEIAIPKKNDPCAKCMNSSRVSGLVHCTP